MLVVISDRSGSSNAARTTKPARPEAALVEEVAVRYSGIVVKRRSVALDGQGQVVVDREGPIEAKGGRTDGGPATRIFEHRVAIIG